MDSVAPRLESTGSIAVACRLSCSVGCGIFPDQGLNPSLLHWQAESLPLSHQGNPDIYNMFHEIREKALYAKGIYRVNLKSCLE